MKTGKGRAKARVLVSDAGQVVLEAETGPDGVLLHDWDAAARGQPPPDLPGPRRRPRGRLGPGRARQGRAGADARAPTSTPTGPPTGRASRSPSGAWSARSTSGQYANVPEGRLSLRGDRQPGPADRRPAA